MTNIVLLKQKNAERWRDVAILPKRQAEVKIVARRLTVPGAWFQYEEISKVTGVPPWVIAVIHEREASQSWKANIAQGDPWSHVSTHRPRGRGPFKSFKDAAIDALTFCPPFAARWHDWSAGGTLTLLELYNGTGYEDWHHEASPYIWAATNHEEWGKYVADGHWDHRVWDEQIGCAAMLKAMMEFNPSIKMEAA